MGFNQGQQLLYMGPETGLRLVTFVAPDEGWSRIQFADESEASVRPSHVRPLNTRTVEIVMDAYAEAIGGNQFYVSHLKQLVEVVADIVGYEPRSAIDELHAAELRSVRG